MKLPGNMNYNLLNANPYQVTSFSDTKIEGTLTTDKGNLLYTSIPYDKGWSVYVDGQKEDKAGSSFNETVNIEVRGNTLKYVSRGGLKLEKAMENFDVTIEGKICMDVGSSTGGFTDCMLQNGAVKVYSVDVGHGQLAWKLRNDERVVCMEKTNIRYVTPEDIADKIDFSSIDVSFISLTKVLLPVKNLLTDDGQIVCLIKPQFEAGREKVGKHVL